MDNPGEKQGLNAASDPRSAGERELEPAASDYVHGVPERDAGDHGSVSPLFGRGATLALLVWGFSVLAFTSSVAGVTMLWPLVPIVGAVVPLALVFLAVQHANNQKKALRGDEIRTLLVTKDSAERAVLGALLKSNGLTPAAAAARTSLSVTQATKVLEDLAGNGHLDAAAVEGSLVYALRDSGRPSPGYASLGSSESRDEDRSELSPSTGPLDEPLTEREIEVMRLLASGRTNREISHELYVSHGTVKAHAANIYRKLDVHNRAEMINRAKTLDLLD
ncbi:MAG: response regulator transcription factor [Actinomycetota bacterium]|nr:response regulator transcription factor [Actinomycetota bacterium]